MSEQKTPVVFDQKCVDHYKVEHPAGEIMVSVLVLVYNHEKYLRKCLDGFVMQKTDFPFEVIIHDDASTDSSAEIIREYEAKYPGLFRCIYQTENQYAKGTTGTLHMYDIARGKYLAFCEGDDYWCDENKLQVQVAFLESHPEVHFCTHRTGACAEDGSELPRSYPNYPLETQVFTGKGFLKKYVKSQIVHRSSFVIDSAYARVYYPSGEKDKQVIPFPFSDVTCPLIYAGFGDVGYLDQTMSVHRMGSAEGWTIRYNRSSSAEKTKRKMSRVRWTEEIDAFFEYCFHEEYEEWIYYRILALADETQNYRLFRDKKNKERLKKYGSRNERVRFGLCAAFPHVFPPVFRLYFKIKGVKIGQISTS